MNRKDILPLYWTKGLDHYYADSCFGTMCISEKQLTLTVFGISGTRVIKTGKSVNDLKQYASDFHKTTLYCQIKKFVKG